MTRYPSRFPRRYGGGSYLEGFCVGVLFAAVVMVALLQLTGGV